MSSASEGKECRGLLASTMSPNECCRFISYTQHTTIHSKLDCHGACQSRNSIFNPLLYSSASTTYSTVFTSVKSYFHDTHLHSYFLAYISGCTCHSINREMMWTTKESSTRKIVVCCVTLSGAYPTPKASLKGQ